MTQIIEDEDRIAYDEDLVRAVALANEGDATECARLVEGVTERLFLVDSDEDPVFQAGTSAMFKLMTYLLIDFCVEEEKELHAVSELAGFSAEHVVDEVEWIRGSVCLACIEHLFSELVRMKATRPHDPERGDYLWTGSLSSESMDLLTLLTVTTAKLPWSPLRHLVMNANDALRAMAGSEKMLESISSLALTSFSRFSDDDVEYRPNPRQMVSKRLVQAVFGVRAFEEYLTSRGVSEGEGQTYIESVIDMWTRERNPSNMVINDPKGELLVKNFVRASVRGYEIVQFNLINAQKTDIYNPLAMAAESARENDATKCAMYVENIAEVFFPTGEGDDPMWSNAANNAFNLPAKDSDEVPDAIMAITRRLIWENSRHESSSPTDCFVPGRDGQGPTIGLSSHQLHFRRLPTV